MQSFIRILFEIFGGEDRANHFAESDLVYERRVRCILSYLWQLKSTERSRRPIYQSAARLFVNMSVLSLFEKQDASSNWFPSEPEAKINVAFFLGQSHIVFVRSPTHNKSRRSLEC